MMIEDLHNFFKKELDAFIKRILYNKGMKTIPEISKMVGVIGV